MLRGKPRFQFPNDGGGGLPDHDKAFENCPERPPGIRFYLAKESFFFPYALLQSIHWRAEKLTILYPHDEVTLSGQGLHALYVELADFKVGQIREQADDIAGDDPLHVSKIERLPRE